VHTLHIAGASWPRLRSERIRIPRAGHFQDVREELASADLFEKLLSLTSKHFTYEYSAVAGCYCLSVQFIVLIVFCAPIFHLLHCFLCIQCDANLLLTILMVVTSILIVHFDICILPKCIFDVSREN